MEIKGPDWYKVVYNLCTAQVEQLNEWFEKEVEPINKLLSEGVEVQSIMKWAGANYIWQDPGDIARSDSKDKPHHKALLINIQEINPKTKEEKLLEALEWALHAYETDSVNVYNDALRVYKEFVE